MTNGFHPERQEAQQAAFVAHVRAELARVGMSALDLAAALGLAPDPADPRRLVQVTERGGLRP